MPLRDHFRPPLSTRRHWHAFHNSWATYLSSDINTQLPRGYFAEANVQFNIEIDVATFEEGSPESISGWPCPAPAQQVPITLVTDSVEIQVFSAGGGPTLAGAVELVSPANKDRPDTRDAFVSKCAAYLQQGVGLAIVDVVTERSANLHDELMTRLRAVEAVRPAALLYAASYRPVNHDGRTVLDLWHERCEIGQPLPTLPLWLRSGFCLRLELEATYERTCREQRVLANGD